MSKNKATSYKFQAASFRLQVICFIACSVWLAACSCLVFAQDKFTPLEKSPDKKSGSLTGFIYDAKGKRNPFIPLVTSDGRLLKLDSKETKGPLAIEGIIYDERGISYAIVNGGIVKIGDIVEEYQVLKIEKDKVFFIKEGVVSELELLNKEAK